LKPIVDGEKENHAGGEKEELPLIRDCAHLFTQEFPAVYGKNTECIITGVLDSFSKEHLRFC